MGWIILLIFGIICAAIANSKGRSVVAWFFIGFFFGIFGLIILLVVGNLKDARQKEMEMQTEQRRLREQLRQERIKNDQFRKHAQVRLDTHDNALGMKTRDIQPLLDKPGNALDINKWDIQVLVDKHGKEKLKDGDMPLEWTIPENEQEEEPRA